MSPTPISFGQVIPVTGPVLGFAGTVSRIGERVITARQFVPTTSSNNLNSLTFSATAGAFNLTTAPASVLTMSGGVENDSTNVETLDSSLTLKLNGFIM